MRGIARPGKPDTGRETSGRIRESPEIGKCFHRLSFRSQPVHRRVGIRNPQRDRAIDHLFFRQREVHGEPNSETNIDVIERRGHQAKYALSPVTGKKHQLRVHMNALSLPILNDRMYPPVAVTPDDDYSMPLQLLAKSIAFDDPVTGQKRYFQSHLALL